MKAWLRRDEAAIYAGVSIRTIDGWFNKGLRRVKIGNCVVLKSIWLDTWLEQFENQKLDVTEITDEILRGLK